MSNFELTSSQIKKFNEDGVLCLRGVLSSSEILKLKQSVKQQIEEMGTSPTGYDLQDFHDQVFASTDDVSVGDAERFEMDDYAQIIRDDSNARPLREQSEDSGEKGMFFYDAAGWKRFKNVRDVAFDSALPEVIASLLDSQTLNFWEDTTFVKAPHTRQKTAFHQDYAYFQITGDQCVIAWIPLDSATPDSGVVRYIRGSHKWGKTYAPNMFITQTIMPGCEDEKLPDIEAHENDYDIISFDVEPGDVVIHHVMTIHGANGNLTNNTRGAMSFRYCGDNVRYYDRPGALVQPFIQNKLHTGDRLRSADYPLVWPKPWPNAKLADLYEHEIGSINFSSKLVAAE